MSNGDLGWITNFIWGIADDVLRDLYVRGKYRDVILPMTVLRRLDAVLEPTKPAVIAMKEKLDKAKVVHQEAALQQAAGQPFYNTSKFTLRDLRSRASQQQLRADFEAYLDGFSPNVQDILEKFEFRNQIPRLSKADALATRHFFLDMASFFRLRCGTSLCAGRRSGRHAVTAKAGCGPRARILCQSASGRLRVPGRPAQRPVRTERA